MKCRRRITARVFSSSSPSIQLSPISVNLKLQISLWEELILLWQEGEEEKKGKPVGHLPASKFGAQPKNRSIPAVSCCCVECDRQASKFGELGKDVAQRLFFLSSWELIPILEKVDRQRWKKMTALKKKRNIFIFFHSGESGQLIRPVSYRIWFELNWPSSGRRHERKKNGKTKRDQLSQVYRLFFFGREFPSVSYQKTARHSLSVWAVKQPKKIIQINSRRRFKKLLATHPISMTIGKPGIWQWPHLVVGRFRFLFITQPVGGCIISNRREIVKWDSERISLYTHFNDMVGRITLYQTLSRRLKKPRLNALFSLLALWKSCGLFCFVVGVGFFFYLFRPSVHRPKKMDVGFEERYTHTRVRQIDGQSI